MSIRSDAVPAGSMTLPAKATAAPRRSIHALRCRTRRRRGCRPPAGVSPARQTASEYFPMVAGRWRRNYSPTFAG
jgi:hypothetical protein